MTSWRVPLALLALGLGACSAGSDAAGVNAAGVDAVGVDRADAADTQPDTQPDTEPDRGAPDAPPAPSTTPATPAAASAPPARLEGLPYVAARAIVLGYGWSPHDGACGGGGTSPAVCRAFPEIGNCSGVGRGFCDMSFDKPGRCLSIVTTGGPPGPTGSGDNQVERVRFTKEACD